MRSLSLGILGLSLALFTPACRAPEPGAPPDATSRRTAESTRASLHGSPSTRSAQGRRKRPDADGGTPAPTPTPTPKKPVPPPTGGKGQGGKGSPDAGTPSGPGPTDGHPAPAGCRNRPPTVTEVHALVRVDQYKGIQHGRNGDHEIAEGTITELRWATNQRMMDTKNVHLAMNIASRINPEGLPKELPVAPGTVIELTGEYIPAKGAHAQNANGPAAVLHFTHAPCGSVVINGTQYQ